MVRGSSSTSNSNEANFEFETFFDGWLVRQEHSLDELHTAKQRYRDSREADLRELVNRVLGHYHQYYDEKSNFARRNVFRLFSPPWFTSLEHTFLWMAGFKPALAFEVLRQSVDDLRFDQEERMQKLYAHTEVEERILEDKMAKIHESLASPTFVELIKKLVSLMERDQEEQQRGVETLTSGLELLVGMADRLRTETVVKIVDILDPVQNVNFFTAVAETHLWIRSLGLQLDAERLG